MQPKVSVIVPVYNVEKYVRQCIESILAQTFTDWELLLVDDGTQDNSGYICDEYAQQDSRIRVFHKKNGGVSSARNLGLENAKGKWITFVDSDDFIGSRYLEQLNASTIVSPKIDFVHCGLQNYVNGEVSINQRYEINESSDCATVFNKFRGLIVAKWFKRDIIIKNKIRFDERMKIAEDYVFTVDYIRCIDRYAFSDCIDYFYRIHQQSATRTERTISDYDVALYEFHRLYDVVETYIRVKNISEKDSKYRRSLLARTAIIVMLILFKSNISNKDIERHIYEDFTQEHRALLTRPCGVTYNVVAFLIRLKQYNAIRAFIKLRHLIV